MRENTAVRREDTTMSPDVLAREIVGPCEFPEAPCTSKGRHPSLCTRCGIAPGVAAAIREAEIRGVALGIAYCEKSLEASGQIIRFARSPESIVAARSAPAPVRPPAVRVPTPEEIASMTPEQAAAETARLKRETGAVGGISRCGTAGSTPEEIARGDLSALSIVARVERETFKPVKAPEGPCACHDLRSGCPYSAPVEVKTPMEHAEIERIARQAIEDYLAGRRDSKGNPRSPASSRCRECDGSRKLGGWADIRDIPCPLCWGKS